MPNANELDAIFFSIRERLGVARSRRDAALRWLKSAMRRVEQEVAEGSDASPTLLEIARHASDAAVAEGEARVHSFWLRKFNKEEPS